MADLNEQLNDARLKDLDELTDDDKALLREHKDDLTDEELTAFKDVLTEPEPAKEPEPFFKSKEEADTYIEDKINARLADIKVPETKEPEPPKDDRFFDEGYKPKDWEDYAEKLFPKFVERMQKMSAAQREKLNQQIAERNKMFDKEIDDLRTKGEPIPARGTKEFEAFDKELAGIGMKFKGVSNMTEAYEIYKATKGTDKGDISDSQKQTASRVGKSGGGSGTVTKDRKYKDVAGRSMDDVMNDVISKLEK